MNFKKLLIVHVLVLGLCSAAHAQPKEEGGMRGKLREQREEHMQKLFDQLNVSDEQKEKLKANKLKNKEAMKALQEQNRSYREALHQELMKPDLDMNKVKDIHEKMKALDAQISDNRLDSILEVRKILTPEQFAKFLTVMKEKMNKFHEDKMEKPEDSGQK